MATPTQGKPVQDKLLEDASLQLVYEDNQYIAEMFNQSDEELLQVVSAGNNLLYKI